MPTQVPTTCIPVPGINNIYSSLDTMPTAPCDYTLAQQRFALNMMANVVGKTPGTQSYLEQQFQTALNNQLPTMAGKWELAWGPKVYKLDPEDPKTPPINAWFVATSATQELSVLAIAGTARSSVLGWLQDFNVAQVVDWNQWVSTWTLDSVLPVPRHPAIIDPDSPYAASGTCHGTANILTYKSTMASAGTSVPQYLGSLPQGYSICVTGHSMGGALSPAVALGLVQANLVNGNNVYVVPSAGASPGNVAWSDLWASKFKQSGQDVDTINADFYNTSDIVPQAWSLDANRDRNFQNVFGETQLYRNVTFGDGIGFVVKHMIALGEGQSKKSGIVYRAIPGVQFPTSLPIPDSITKWVDFGTVFTNQHVVAYQSMINIQIIVQGFQDDLQGPQGLDSQHQSAHDEAELKALAHRIDKRHTTN
jgi:hypothetical protein